MLKYQVVKGHLNAVEKEQIIELLKAQYYLKLSIIFTNLQIYKNI